MKEVIWIFGTSASGKETFIKNILENSELRAKFGWKGRIVKASQSSIQNVGQFENDPIVNDRELIIEETQELLESGDVVLIKWQSVDTQTDRLRRLRELTPKVKQRIIWLEASRKELIERLARKVWWHDYGQEEQFINDELKEVDSVIAMLAGDFEVIKVSASSLDDYQLKS